MFIANMFLNVSGWWWSIGCACNSFHFVSFFVRTHSKGSTDINIGTCAFFGVGCFRFDSSSIIGVLRRTCHGLSLGQRPFVRVVCLFDGNADLFVQLHLEVLEEHLCFGSSANCVRLVV